MKPEIAASELQKQIGPSNEDFQRLCMRWGENPYAPLSVLLTSLIALARVHQTNHWQAKGDAFYGDHLLYERLYSGVLEEIDSVAERVVGLGGIKCVNPVTQVEQVQHMVSVFLMMSKPHSFPQHDDLLKRSLSAEVYFLSMVDMACDALGEKLTFGTENLLAGIADKHESHVYLLRQRAASEELVQS